MPCKGCGNDCKCTAAKCGDACKCGTSCKCHGEAQQCKEQQCTTGHEHHDEHGHGQGHGHGHEHKHGEHGQQHGAKCEETKCSSDKCV